MSFLGTLISLLSKICRYIFALVLANSKDTNSQILISKITRIGYAIFSKANNYILCLVSTILSIKFLRPHTSKFKRLCFALVNYSTNFYWGLSDLNFIYNAKSKINLFIYSRRSSRYAQLIFHS